VVQNQPWKRLYSTIQNAKADNPPYLQDMRRIDMSKSTEELLKTEFSHLVCDEPKVSSVFVGGQSAANKALANLDITGYARKRSQILPVSNRGASALSPYIRHNLLSLRQVWDAVADADFEDRSKFRDELLWQEYSRHLYARIGNRLFSELRYHQQHNNPTGNHWNREMNCINQELNELEESGWLVNQARMWLSSDWAVRHQADWLEGQEIFYKHLLDGSRAANLLGWQWNTGSGTGKPYGFAQWQVQKRAPVLCQSCSLKNNCPIAEFPDTETLQPVIEDDYRLSRDNDAGLTRGPRGPIHEDTPEVVLLTIDSLGDADAAMSANPDLPVWFVFYESKLQKLQLSSKRIGFYIQTLQDLSERRDVHVFLGERDSELASQKFAVTWAPVPSFRPLANSAVELHPWPWLVNPHGKSVKSYSAWRNHVELPTKI
jgi:deoxyribodipyrimidine photo-lyase